MSYLRRFTVGFVFLVISVPGFGHKEVLAVYPEKPIKIIVPFGAGGGFDGMARALAYRLEKEVGVTIVIQNRPGAGGRRGGITLFKSKPDGYTLGMAHYIPFMSDKILLGKKPSIDYKKFSIVLKVSKGRHFVFVSKKTPFKSLDDLKKASKPVKFSGTGIGAITWVEGSALGATVGFPVTFVTGYRNLPRATMATARGDADAGLGSYHHFQGVLADLRPLVFLGNERDHHLPDVPSIRELGYKNLTNLGSPRVISAPPGTPESRLAVIRKALEKVVRQPDFVAWAKETGYYLEPEGPEGFWKGLDAQEKIFLSLRPLIMKATGK